MTRVTHYSQIVIVVGASRIAPRNDVVKVQRRRPIKPTDLALFFDEFRLISAATLHSLYYTIQRKS